MPIAVVSLSYRCRIAVVLVSHRCWIVAVLPCRAQRRICFCAGWGKGFSPHLAWRREFYAALAPDIDWKPLPEAAF
jgi:hypothetical protein